MSVPVDFYEMAAGRYDASINEIFYQNIARELLSAVGDIEGVRTILEVGAGVGFSTSVIRSARPRADVTALEPSRSMARRGCRRVPEARWEVLPLASMTSDCFDLVFSSMSYHWLDSAERKKLSAMARNGCLAIALATGYDRREGDRGDDIGNGLLKKLVVKMRPDVFWARADRRAEPLMEALGRSFNRVRETRITPVEVFPDGRVFADTLYARGTLLALFSDRAEEARNELAAMVGLEEVSFTWRVALITAY